jgi:hypothetical protein
MSKLWSLKVIIRNRMDELTSHALSCEDFASDRHRRQEVHMTELVARKSMVSTWYVNALTLILSMFVKSTFCYIQKAACKSFVRCSSFAWQPRLGPDPGGLPYMSLHIIIQVEMRIHFSVNSRR